MADNDLMIYDENDLKSKIYIIRGMQVMLDFDLAKIYGYETKNFNRQVKNNIAKFDDDFRFQLTKKEYENILRCNFFTSKSLRTHSESTVYGNAAVLKSKNLISKPEKRGGRQYLPYAFTEQGVYMLMTVLKGDLATQQSKMLIRLFKQMKDFIIQSNDMLPAAEVRALSIQTHRNTEDIRQIKQKVDDLTVVIKDFTDPNIKKDYLFFNGQTVEADIAYSEIYSHAKKTIHIIDNYIGLKTLVLLKSINNNVIVTIFSDNINHTLHGTEFVDFQKEYPNVNITLKALGGTYHDRYIFIDSGTKNELIFHCGGSSKDSGKRVTSITKVEDVLLYQGIIGNLQSNSILIL